MLFLHRRVGFAVSVLGEQPLLSAGQGDSSKRHLQMQQSLCWAHLIHMLCRKKSPGRFLHIPGWAQRKSGGSWRSPAAPSLLCLEERVWASGHNWHCRKLSICYQLSSDSVSATKCLGNVSGQTTLSALLGIKKTQTNRKKKNPDHVSLCGFLEFLLKHCLLALNSFLFDGGS